MAENNKSEQHASAVEKRQSFFEQHLVSGAVSLSAADEDRSTFIPVP